jgi:hypothetical protein
VERKLFLGAAELFLTPFAHNKGMEQASGQSKAGKAAKKKSPTEIIESASNPDLEHAFVKFRGKELEDITIDSSTDRQSIQVPVGSKEQRMRVHTHLSSLPKERRSALDTMFPGLFHPESKYKERKEISYGALPSPKDMELFLEAKNERAAAIAVREPETGKVRGYTVIMKTDKTPKPGILGLNLAKDIDEYRKGYKIIGAMHASFETLASKYHLKFRFLPAEGYQLNETKTQFVKKK